MEQDPSPEEILLRLIKGGKQDKPLQKARGAAEEKEPEKDDDWDDGNDAVAPAEPAHEKPAPKKPSPLSAMQARLVFWRQEFHGGLHWLSQFFLFLSAVMAGLILFNLIHDRIGAHQKLNRIWSAGLRPARADTARAAPYAPNATAEGLPDKDLFKSLEEPAPAISGPGPARVASLDQILSNYTLAGIIGGDQPQAIIEDKRQGKTFFLNVGDMLGEIRIVAIKEGKVIIAIGGEQAELDL